MAQATRGLLAAALVGIQLAGLVLVAQANTHFLVTLEALVLRVMEVAEVVLVKQATPTAMAMAVTVKRIHLLDHL
jgi:hypothetical protein